MGGGAYLTNPTQPPAPFMARWQTSQISFPQIIYIPNHPNQNWITWLFSQHCWVWMDSIYTMVPHSSNIKSKINYTKRTRYLIYFQFTLLFPSIFGGVEFMYPGLVCTNWQLNSSLSSWQLWSPSQTSSESTTVPSLQQNLPGLSVAMWRFKFLVFWLSSWHSTYG